MLTFLQNFLAKSQNYAFTILLAHSFREEDKNDRPQPKRLGFLFLQAVRFYESFAKCAKKLTACVLAQEHLLNRDKDHK